MLESKVVLTCLTIVKLYSCVHRTSADRTWQYLPQVSRCIVILVVFTVTVLLSHTRFFHTCIFQYLQFQRPRPRHQHVEPTDICRVVLARSG